METLVTEHARDLIRDFKLAAVRIWMIEGPDARLALVASHSDAHLSGGMHQAAVADCIAPTDAPALMLVSTAGDARFEGERPTGGFIGVPIVADGVRYGFIEAYGSGALALGLAAELESNTAEFAAAVALRRPTAELESSSKGRILVADDDAGIRTLLRLLLTRRGFDVDDVSNGLLALESAKRQPPDLILIDWVMPIMDGRETITRLKADPVTRNIPVVMLTSQSQVDDKVAALEAGAQDFLTKPFDSRELVARVEQQMRWRKLLADVEPAAEPVAVDAVGATTATSARTRDVQATSPKNDAPLDADLFTGDVWSKAVEASQLGKNREALALYLHESERCDAQKLFPRAAIAYRSASIAAGQMQNLDLSNKLLRLAGKMYLSWAETATDIRGIQEGYLGAARCFLTAGNLKLAKKATDFAYSYESVIGDDRPPSLA
jgi:DNA-binding response OmpR family regulator